MTEADVIAAVRTYPSLLPVGNNTKPRLGPQLSSTHRLDLRDLNGITEYQPSEYTISARAGTPLRDLQAALKAKGQYLPFDPCWIEAGATLGGTVAANAGGPGQIRFGGVRDFVIGVTLVDGRGRLIRGGGKVVKNAAGFDLPKFLTGSLGRWGVMTEITCKVFPRPAATASCQWQYGEHLSAVQQMMALGRSRFEPDALEYFPAERRLVMRLRGPAESVESLARQVGGEPGPPIEWWQELTEFRWVPPAYPLVRIPLSPRSVPPLLEDLEQITDCRVHVGAAGNVLWVASLEEESLQNILGKHQLTGRAYSGPATRPWLGRFPERRIDVALQAVFDPDHRFVE